MLAFKQFYLFWKFPYRKRIWTPSFQWAMKWRIILAHTRPSTSFIRQQAKTMEEFLAVVHLKNQRPCVLPKPPDPLLSAGSAQPAAVAARPLSCPTGAARGSGLDGTPANPAPAAICFAAKSERVAASPATDTLLLCSGKRESLQTVRPSVLLRASSTTFAAREGNKMGHVSASSGLSHFPALPASSLLLFRVQAAAARPPFCCSLPFTPNPQVSPGKGRWCCLPSTSRLKTLPRTASTAAERNKTLLCAHQRGKLKWAAQCNHEQPAAGKLMFEALNETLDHTISLCGSGSIFFYTEVLFHLNLHH